MSELESGSPPSGDGAEEKAANILNAVMIMLLAVVLAALASWSIFDFLGSLLSADPTVSWREDGVMRFLLPLGLIGSAASMFRLGFPARKPKAT